VLGRTTWYHDCWAQCISCGGNRFRFFKTS